ncbi:MAG: BREX system P-loop protein BrxC, partial [Acidobacteria bacterium]|nr:BREX system P-loop protein BrxC [Acidobacteriota bacterium]
MKIHETLIRDPHTTALANNGQARITDHADAKARAELRAELETFVCDGQFGQALEKIFDRYLSHLDSSRQEAAWVSGFFGSGKSHLLKMLTHLWADTRFEDGATARNLVLELPDEVRAHLRELDAQATRLGTIKVAAAGTLLGGNEHVRQTVLSVIFRAAGWPTAYPQAGFCFWLREQGILENVRHHVEAEGRSWFHELNNLYVSPYIASAVLEAAPGLAEDAATLRKILTQQFPQLHSDITTEEFVEAARNALEIGGQLPLTLLVLDEVQQYINEASDRATTLTELAEAIKTQLDSRVMLVGAGQSALSVGTEVLMWLRDRFRIAIELTDADVEAVTRKVLLRKKPSAEAPIDEMLEANAGEIDRHLRDTRLGPRPEDQSTRVADYPLLPTRRRFWEACFQAVDAAGAQSQLRSQLRILYDSLVAIADRSLGAAIPASDLFTALAPSLVNTGVLLNEINTRIQKLDDETEEGRLRKDLCGLVFLIGKLPRSEPVDQGLRATPTILADLLIDDIARDSGPFRKRVEDVLAGLATEGVLMVVGDEYRLQTTEGAEWERELTERRTALRQQPAEIATRREQLFGESVQRVLGGITLTQGTPKIRRNLLLHLGAEPPPPGQEAIPVWVRDGWSASSGTVEAEARSAGADDSTIHVFLPRRQADALKKWIIEAEAARQVL